jgi:hypothetical protein
MTAVLLAALCRRWRGTALHIPFFNGLGGFRDAQRRSSFSRALRMCGALRTRPRIIVPFTRHADEF